MLDRDDDDGGAETLARLVEQHGPLPPTLTSETADGVHYYFAADRDLPNTAGKIGTGIDTRAAAATCSRLHRYIPPASSTAG